jgi:O-acetyl-ADP-ribose deacetylase (regulator of RNase III)
MPLTNPPSYTLAVVDVAAVVFFFFGVYLVSLAIAVATGKTNAVMESRTYRVGRSTITLIFGDITTSRAEVLVSSDDCFLSMGGGVSDAISRAAGPSYRRDGQKIARPHPANVRRRVPGEVVVTSAGELGARYVLHAITRAPRASISSEAIVRQACQRAMQLLPLLGCRSVAFPSIGTGFAGIDPVVAAEQMAAVLVRALLETDEEYEVELYLMDRWINPGAAASFFPAFEEYVTTTLALAVLESDGARSLSPPAEPGAGAAGDREAGRRFDIYSMLRRLDERRDDLDAQVHASMAEPAPDGNDTLRRLSEQLESVARLRRIYESELVLPLRSSDVQRGSVFLSSTWEDLQDYRSRARAVIDRLRLRFIGMEDFPPTSTAAVDLIRQEVNRAETYVALIGMRYGSVDPALGFSMTELEYRQAVASRKPRHVFVMSDRAHVPISMMEKDPDRFRKLMEFRDRILKENTVRFFDDAEDLERQVEATLRRVFKRSSS